MLVNRNSKMIAKVLGNFDFVQTQKNMDNLDWFWGTGQDVPVVSELVDTAFNLLVKALTGNGFAASGGFEATFHNGQITLKFVLEESQFPPEPHDFVYVPVSPVSVGDAS